MNLRLLILATLLALALVIPWCLGIAVCKVWREVL